MLHYDRDRKCRRTPRPTKWRRNKAGVTTHRRVFVVRVDNKQDGEPIVLAAPGLPQMFDGYQTDTDIDLASIVINRRAKQIGDSLVWEVDIAYSSAQEPGAQSDQPENADPLDLQPIIRIGYETFQVPIPGEINFDAGVGDPPFAGAILNSVRESFDPPPMKDESRPILTITINLPEFPSAEVLPYQDAVNNDVFFGAVPRQLKMMGGPTTTGRTKSTGGGVTVFYFPVTYTMAFKRDLWDLQLLDQGTFFIEEITGVKRSFLTNDGIPYIGLLDGTGGKLDDADDPVYLRFFIYPQENFGELAPPRGLPQDINSFVRV